MSRFREIGCVFADGGLGDYRVGGVEGAIGLRMYPRQGDRRGQGGLCEPALSHTPFHLFCIAAPGLSDMTNRSACLTETVAVGK